MKDTTAFISADSGRYIRHTDHIVAVPSGEQRTTYQQRSTGTEGRAQAVSSAQTGSDRERYYQQAISA